MEEGHDAMAYEKHAADDLILRDHLAIDRTKLANERTLLAYLRTAIMFLVSGVSLIKLFPEDDVLVVLGMVLGPIGAVVGLIGAVQFLKMKRRIRRDRR